MEQKIYELLLEIQKDIKEVKGELRGSSMMVNERLDRIEEKLINISEAVESIEALKYRLTNIEKDTARLKKLKGLQ